MTTRNILLHPVMAAAIAINVFVLGLAVAASGSDKSLWHLLGEDGIVEWMQFIAFITISGLLGMVAVDRIKRGNSGKLEILGLLGVCALTAAAAFEEISWFQRVLDVQSPDFFVQNNRQAETNLHNLALGSASIHKTILLKLILIVGLVHNLVLPIMARSRPAIRNFVESLGLYLPPVSVSVVYVVLVALSHALIEHPRKGELGEMFGAVHYLATVFGAYFVGIQYNKPALFESKPETRRVAVMFAMFMVFLLFISWLLSSGAGQLAAAAR